MINDRKQGGPEHMLGILATSGQEEDHYGLSGRHYSRR